MVVLTVLILLNVYSVIRVGIGSSATPSKPNINVSVWTPITLKMVYANHVSLVVSNVPN